MAAEPHIPPESASPPPGRPEDALRGSLDLLRAVFEGLDEALLLLDGDGTVLAANGRFAALCGVPAEALAGTRWRESAAMAPFLPADPGAALAGGAPPQARRVRAADSGGGMRILDVRVLPLAGAAPGAGRLLLRVADVTEQVQAEAQMLLGERRAANERLAATVAHEVNTPLQAIENSLHLAGKLADEGKRSAYLRLAREEIQRVGRILRQLLELHRPPAEPVSLSLNELVERVLLLSGSTRRRAGIRLARELAPGLPPVVGRADELTQVLLNLIFNALHAMPKGGRLTLRTEHRPAPAGPGLVVVTVQDNGPGVDAALGERIFEPFVTTRESGTGLGLAVSRQIVEGHGGRLTLAAAPGGGASFQVELPASTDEGG